MYRSARAVCGWPASRARRLRCSKVRGGTRKASGCLAAAECAIDLPFGCKHCMTMLANRSTCRVHLVLLKGCDTIEVLPTNHGSRSVSRAVDTARRGWNRRVCGATTADAQLSVGVMAPTAAGVRRAAGSQQTPPD